MHVGARTLQSASDQQLFPAGFGLHLPGDEEVAEQVPLTHSLPVTQSLAFEQHPLLTSRRQAVVPPEPA
jgi:hypothetical protein